jgi:hypothetical protein
LKNAAPQYRDQRRAASSDIQRSFSLPTRIAGNGSVIFGSVKVTPNFAGSAGATRIAAIAQAWNDEDRIQLNLLRPSSRAGRTFLPER